MATETYKKKIGTPKIQRYFGLLSSFFFIFLSADEYVVFSDEELPLALFSVPLLGVFAVFSFIFALSSLSIALRPLPILGFALMVPIQAWRDPRGLSALGFGMVAIVLLLRNGFFLRRPWIKALGGGAFFALLILLPAYFALQRPLLMLPALAEALAVVAVSFALAKGRILAAFSPKKGVLSLSACGLSWREVAFAHAMMRGEPVKELARRSALTESTVRNTLSTAYKKLGVGGILELRELAVKYKITE
jgi:DNA-binding CsgD family transcriptional regulator